MTTIILTTIGILLAALAALMISFYGGDMFNDSTTSATANRYMNAGVNVVAAIDQYRMNEKADPASIDDLVQAGYFKPAGVPGTMNLTPGTPGKFTIADVPSAICQRINDTVHRNASDDATGAAGTFTGGATMQGCTMQGATGTYYAAT